MWLDDAGARANKLVAEWILAEYRKDGGDEHLRACPDAAIESTTGGDGEYGCDTGCEFVRLQATVSCPHDRRDENWDYGDFGDLSTIIRELELGRDVRWECL